jgi:hypothetical protein
MINLIKYRRNLDKPMTVGIEKWLAKLKKVSFDTLFCIKI